MDFTKNNKQLAGLFTVDFPEDTILLPNKKMPRGLYREAAVMYEALFGAPMDPEDFTLLLKAENGELKRIYGPSVSKDPEGLNLAVKWGEHYTSLTLDGTTPVGPKLGKGFKWETFALGMSNFGYKDDEIALQIMLETPDGFYELNLPLRFQDPKNTPTLAGFKTLLKKDPETALAFLYDAFEGAGGGGGASINKLQDLGEGAILSVTEFEVYEFTSKKGEELSRLLLIDNEGNKYWSPNGLENVYHLFSLPATLEVIELAESKKSKYIAHGKFYDNDGYLYEFGSKVKAHKEKELPANDYNVWGVKSFQGKNQSFVSYVYTIEPNNDKTIITCFAPSKHRTVLASNPIIDKDHPASFTILKSGIPDEKEFAVTKLTAHFELGEDDLDLANLF